ncbi:Bifunctional solanapyrone synthase [Cytospora mali]|uniref:Bifunctional solanapyrone synthase n=1 Tax=Cytospora mali TaxID=578113 RepID=A0A194VU25_CYTMA|nr:Bifunctional solanapyrone synthase [Valsa mali]
MSASTAIHALQSAFPGDQIALPGTEQYATWNTSYLAQQESDIQPACIFRPKSSQQVSQLLQLISPFAASGEAPFAIRGAGNMPEPGCANVQDGITLNLGLMTDIELDQDKGMVRVQAGAKWGGAVDAGVQAAGLGVCGGRSGNGGIGGLALTVSSGLSFFSSREGFISDNVLNFEIALASGEVVNANADENHDLWLALKGGSNNFGVVTRFDFQTFTQGPFWGGNVYYFPPIFPAQIDALAVELNRHVSEQDPDTHIMISTGYASQFKTNMCLNTVYYTKEATEAPSALVPFTHIQPQLPQLNSLRPLSLTEAAAGQAAGVSNQVRCLYMNMTVRADASTLKNAADLYTSGIAPLQESVAGLVCSFTLQPYPVPLLRASVAKGGNSLGLDPEVPAVSILLLTYWTSRDNDDRVGATMKAILEAIQGMASERKTALEFVYLNYAAAFQDPIASYGEENRRRLQEVSRKYDPQGLFQKAVPGGFKLF